MDSLTKLTEVMRGVGWEKHIPKPRAKIDELMPGITSISVPQPFYLATRAYLIKGGVPALVDPGHAFPTSIESLLAGLKEAGSSPAGIGFLAATHAHVDHASAMVVLDGTFKCHKGMHESAFGEASDYRVFLKGAIERYEPRKRHIMALGVPREKVEAYPRVYFLGDGRISLDTPLKHQGTVRMGDRDWKVLHTPGHYPHHVAFLDEEEGLLISGDIFIGRATSLGNVSEYLATLDMLEGIGARTVLPGHGKPMMDLGEQVRVARGVIKVRVEKAIDGFRDRAMNAGELGLFLFGRQEEINLGSNAITMSDGIIEHLLGRGMIAEVEQENGHEPARYKVV
jgi:glyoxylase-like metal-dependent hydrolase (beta-lactamase superfamily II)